jgi:hypothetical protein
MAAPAVEFQARIDAFLANHHHDPLMGLTNDKISRIPQLIVHDDMRVEDIDTWEATVHEILAYPNSNRPIEIGDKFDPLNVYVFIGRIPKAVKLPFNTQNQLILYHLRRAIDGYNRHVADVTAKREDAMARRGGHGVADRATREELERLRREMHQMRTQWGHAPAPAIEPALAPR